MLNSVIMTGRMVADPEIVQMRTNQLRRQFPVRRRDGYHRASRHPGRCAAFVHVDMCRFRAEDTVEGAGYGLQRHRVGSCSIKHKKRRS